MDKTIRQLDISGPSAAERRAFGARSASARSASRRTRVPRFFLYGEPPREAAEGFVHVETIPDRSRLYDWTIRPHAHRDLDQLLLVTAGQGEMRIESRTEPFSAPSLLLVPATLVHAFEFERETRGYVVSISNASLRQLAVREPAFHAIFGVAAAVGLAPAEASVAELEEAVTRLHRETERSALARRIAAEARLTVLLVAVSRLLTGRYGCGSSRWVRPTGVDPHPVLPASPSVRRFGASRPRAALVTRFRDVIDARFGSGWTLARFAGELGVSAERLRAACLDVAGKPPMRLVHERLMLEAKRLLRYTPLTIAETAYELGFADPAYFSRFFSEHAGEPPIAFRRRTAGPDG